MSTRMPKLAPQHVYITTEANEKPLSRRRIEAMLASFNAGSVAVVTEEELNAIAPDMGWTGVPRWGEQPSDKQHDPDVVFTTGKFIDDEEKQRRAKTLPNLRVRDLLGHRTHIYRVDGEDWWRKERKGIVCQPAWQLHTINGCPFRCAYCELGGLIRILTNLEAYCEHLPEWFQLSPQQRLYKWDNQTDVILFEPEYNATRLLVEVFARESDRYLEIYAGKSDNVDFLLEYDHRGHTILQWSVAGHTQIEQFEPRTASMESRIEAARKCQEAGYLIRYRFSPIIPVANWREDNRELIELIFERTRPDVISLCAFGWMDLEEARGCLSLELLDPEVVAAMEAAAPFLREQGYTIGGTRPIPHDTRASIFRFLIDEIHRHNPNQVIALCLETEAMWRQFEADLRQRSRNYVCNCGGMCTPGWPPYDRMVNQPAG
ncbi:MAG: spore photoproduct lyase family protein [Candidatus Zipacnadales bacterium]